MDSCNWYSLKNIVLETDMGLNAKIIKEPKTGIHLSSKSKRDSLNRKKKPNENKKAFTINPLLTTSDKSAVSAPQKPSLRQL